MKITAVDGFHLIAPLSRPAGNANGFMTARQALLIRIRTDSGLVGWGEAGPAPDGASACLKRAIAPSLIGRDPCEIGWIWHDLMARRGYDRQGVAMMAISAVDIALHDILSRACGISVAAMLGGALRDSHFAYASGPYLVQGEDPYAGFREEIAGFVKAGFAAIKPRVGGRNSTSVDFIRQMRSDLGDDIALMIDLNGGYSPADAHDLLDRIADAGLCWAEEPVSLEGLDGNARVARSSAIPIATGESLATLHDFRALLERVEVSVLQPDLTVCGGYTGLRQVAALARAFDVPVVPHIWGSAVGYYAALQMTATLPQYANRRSSGYPWVELDCGENPLMGILGTIGPDRQGRVAMPDGNGIGVELNPERFEQWLDDSWSV